MLVLVLTASDRKLGGSLGTKVVHHNVILLHLAEITGSPKETVP